MTRSFTPATSPMPKRKSGACSRPAALSSTEAAHEPAPKSHHRRRGRAGRQCRRPEPRLWGDRHRIRRARGCRGGCARRRTRHARNRPARTAPHGRAHRRGGAFRRLSVRDSIPLRRAGVATRARPRICHWRHSHSDRERRGAIRHAQRRRQKMGSLRSRTATWATRRRRR